MNMTNASSHELCAVNGPPGVRDWIETLLRLRRKFGDVLGLSVIRGKTAGRHGICSAPRCD